MSLGWCPCDQMVKGVPDRPGSCAPTFLQQRLLRAWKPAEHQPLWRQPEKLGGALQEEGGHSRASGAAVDAGEAVTPRQGWCPDAPASQHLSMPADGWVLAGPRSSWIPPCGCLIGIGVSWHKSHPALQAVQFYATDIHIGLWPLSSAGHGWGRAGGSLGA